MKQISEDIDTYVKLVGIYDKYVEDVKPTVYFLGLIGEISELAGAVNQVDVFSPEEDHVKSKQKIADELGDVMWYWFALAKALNYNYKNMWNIVIINAKHSNPEGNEILDIVSSGGRVVEHLKKSIRDDGGKITAQRAERIQEKMVETLDHILMFCKSIGVTPWEVLQRNYDKLYARNEAGTLQGEGDGVTKEERS